MLPEIVLNKQAIKINNIAGTTYCAVNFYHVMDGSFIMHLSWMVLLCTVVCSTATRDEMVYALL